MGQIFKTEYGIIFFIFAIAISAVISFYYYRNTDLPASKKNLLITIRALTIFLILLLLSAPVFSFIVNTERTPVNVILIDNSESLTIEARDSILKNVFNEKFSGLSTSGENFFFSFSNDLMTQLEAQEVEILTFTGINNFETNLTSSFQSIRDRFINRNLSSITILSDGIINEGGNPLSSSLALNVPVNYVLIGDTTQKKDVSIRNIFFNKVTFIESTTPVKAEILSYGYDNNIRVHLLEDGKIISSKDIQTVAGKNLYEVEFNLTSNTEGVKSYKIEAEKLDDEITHKNNYREFLIKFIDNKFKILVLSGGPGPDFAFLSQEIKKVLNFESTIRTQKNTNEFYEGPLPDISEFDSYIFIGFPTAVTNPFLIEDLRQSINKKRSSLFFFSSRNTDYTKLSVLEEILPFNVISVSDIEEVTGLNVISNPDFETLGNFQNLLPVNDYPEIFMNSMNVISKPSSETFMISSRNSMPVFMMNNTPTSRSAAFLAHGIYKWRLNKFNLNPEETLNSLLTETLIKITDKEKSKAFSIETSKQVYSKYEDVIFRAFIQNYDVQGGERIVVNISGNNFDRELSLVKKSNNYFEGTLNIPENGFYNFTSVLYNNDIQVDSDYNGFLIGDYNNEFIHTKADPHLLSLLQSETGGRNFTYMEKNEIENFLTEINKEYIEEYTSLKNFPVNINPFFLSFLILCLSLEWFLRKRNNLP